MGLSSIPNHVLRRLIRCSRLLCQLNSKGVRGGHTDKFVDVGFYRFANLFLEFPSYNVQVKVTYLSARIIGWERMGGLTITHMSES
jgi:hypothetical protein